MTSYQRGTLRDDLYRCDREVERLRQRRETMYPNYYMDQPGFDKDLHCQEFCSDLPEVIRAVVGHYENDDGMQVTIMGAVKGDEPNAYTMAFYKGHVFRRRGKEKWEHQTWVPVG